MSISQLIRERLESGALTTRHIDVDGKLHVDVSHISKAMVCPYYGREIPDAEALRLDPGTIYMLLRDPEELARAAQTANNMPLLDEHIAFTANDVPVDNVVGSTGTDAVFNAPYLDNSLVIWSDVAIIGVENKAKCELSCSYRYRADMTPGIFEGLHYDGVMRDIVFNHLALVTEGRAGPDVVVGDSKRSTMALSRRAVLLQGAMASALRPVMAADAKIDFGAVLHNVTNENFKAQKPTIIQRLARATEGKLTVAFDAKPIELAMDAVEAEDAMEDDDTDAMDKKAKDRKAKDAKRAKDRRTAYDAMCAEDGEEADEDEHKAREESDKAEDARRASDGEAEETDEEARQRYSADRKRAKDKKAKDAGMDKKAMDAAIKSAVDKAKVDILAGQRAIDEAKTAVRPHIGEVLLAMDSAEDIYRLALDGQVELDGTESLSALRNMVKMLPDPSARPPRDLALAMDTAGGDALKKIWPKAGSLHHA